MSDRQTRFGWVRFATGACRRSVLIPPQIHTLIAGTQAASALICTAISGLDSTILTQLNSTTCRAHPA
jgi:hypothetical protein